MGNSEVGHVNPVRPYRLSGPDAHDVEIKERTFFANPTLTGAVDKAVAAGKAVHIMGLLSAGGVHSHEDHIMAMVELAAERGAEKSICTPSDGRDTPPRSAKGSLEAFEDKFAALGKRPRRPSLVVTMPWTATTAGTALSKPMICRTRQRRVPVPDRR